MFQLGRRSKRGAVIVWLGRRIRERCLTEHTRTYTDDMDDMDDMDDVDDVDGQGLLKPGFASGFWCGGGWAGVDGFGVGSDGGTDGEGFGRYLAVCEEVEEVVERIVGLFVCCVIGGCGIFSLSRGGAGDGGCRG